LIGEDNFDRADANPPTGNWSVVSGEWEIDGNELNCITEGPLITTNRQRAPRRAGNGYNSRIVVDLVIPASGGAEWKIITAYRSSSDYNWIHLEYDGSTGELTPTFYLNASEIMSTTTHPGGELWTPDPGVNFTMEICCSFIEWTITNVGTQGDIIWHTCDDSGLTVLPTAPLGGQGLLFGRFDNWFHYIHWESDSACQKCQCFCVDPGNINNYKCLPETLHMVLTPDQVTPTCSLDDLELDLYLSEPDVSGASPVYNATPIRKRWYSDLFVCEGETLWFVLVCDNDYPMTLSLLAYPNLDPDDDTTNNVFIDNGTIAKLIPPISVDCDPVSLDYGSLVSVGVITCDLLDGGGIPIGTGSRPLCCDGCWADGEAPIPTWSVTVTE
jgi:hypothetical protein